MKHKLIILHIIFFFCSIIATGQDFEIRTVNKGMGIVGVEMRIVNGTAPAAGDFVTDLVFGIKWNIAYNVTLLNEISTTYNIKKSGGTLTRNSFSYQAFSADPIGFTVPAGWSINTWIEIMSVSNSRTSLGTGVFEICEPGFDATTEPNFALNFTDFTPVINGSASGVILPVEISSFEAKPAGRNIELTWITQKEINNRGFEIQRYQEESNQYKPIGWINAFSNAVNGHTYNFTDDKVLVNVLYLYRLKQVDIDGKSVLSYIRSAKVAGVVNESFRISPNPASSFINLSLAGQAVNGRFLVKILDSKGALMLSQYEVFAAGRLITVPVSKLPTAQYVFIIEQGDKIIYQANFQKD
jgi:hypothetical protein